MWGNHWGRLVSAHESQPRFKFSVYNEVNWRPPRAPPSPADNDSGPHSTDPNSTCVYNTCVYCLWWGVLPPFGFSVTSGQSVIDSVSPGSASSVLAGILPCLISTSGQGYTSLVHVAWLSQPLVYGFPRVGGRTSRVVFLWFPVSYFSWKTFSNRFCVESKTRSIWFVLVPDSAFTQCSVLCF